MSKKKLLLVTLKVHWVGIHNVNEGNHLMTEILNHAPSDALRGEAAYALGTSEMINGNSLMTDHYLTIAASYDIPPDSRRDVLLLRSYDPQRQARPVPCE